MMDMQNHKFKNKTGQLFLVEGICTDVYTNEIMVVYRNYPMTLEEELYRQIFTIPLKDFELLFEPAD